MDNWHGLLDHSGPYATVALDTSRPDEAGAAGVTTRWENARRELTGQGTPEPVADAIGAALQSDGAAFPGRLLIATEKDGLVLDVPLPRPPSAAVAAWDAAPVLMPAVRTHQGVTPYLLVRIDRAGADLELHGATGEPVQQIEIEGSNDELRKVPGGGWSHLRYQHRAEDSWERNAAEVAQAVEKLFRRHRPELVMVAGEDHAVSHFQKHLGSEASTVTRRLPTGGRAEGISAEAVAEAVEACLNEHRQAREAELADRFELGEGRQDTAVSGLDGVVDVLRRGQAEEILLHDDPSSTYHLWVGDGPLQIATDAAEVRAMGTAEPVKLRADTALAWAALASQTGITVLEHGTPRLNDGIGALLRWSDASTPRDAVPSMPGHGEPRGGESVR
nr:Vms1/Ankzf1 family peptidyl-tRNA hydrolase [Kineosporia rhizophila]